MKHNNNSAPSISSWLKAFRLRTLPLALSSILMGSFLAVHDGLYSWPVIVMAAVTTILLQILSNMANDYGDSQKGTDNINRLGPTRTVQGGEITPSQMKKGIFGFIFLSLFSGIYLLFLAFGTDFWKAGIFFLIGIGAIAAAIKYTVGKNAYGYSGLGDLFVFLFFGLAGVLGTYYLNAKILSWDILLPAISVGFLSVGVLNLNNMRDVENDIESGKHTLVARLGIKNAKIYHGLLLVVAILAAVGYAMINYTSIWNFLFLLPCILIAKDLQSVVQEKENVKLDPYLKKLAIATLLFVVFFGVGILI